MAFLCLRFGIPGKKENCPSSYVLILGAGWLHGKKFPEDRSKPIISAKNLCTPESHLKADFRVGSSFYKNTLIISMGYEWNEPIEDEEPKLVCPLLYLNLR
jgi:hypothetical protein